MASVIGWAALGWVFWLAMKPLGEAAKTNGLASFVLTCLLVAALVCGVAANVAFVAWLAG